MLTTTAVTLSVDLENHMSFDCLPHLVNRSKKSDLRRNGDFRLSVAVPRCVISLHPNKRVEGADDLHGCCASG